MKQSKPHLSVMSEEVLELLSPQDSLTYIDATFGAGGHTRAILTASPRCNVIALDRDHSVKVFADKMRDDFPGRFEFINTKFSNIKSIIGSQKIDGVLFDIGVSSMQIDDPERGFSFMKDGPLTMTMGENSISAYDVVNKFREEKIAEILLKYGDERAAYKIAKVICHNRKKSPITTTLQLAEIVREVVPRRGKIHPATLTFQALRVFVNEELRELEIGLKDAIEGIAEGGKIVVITFQGLEDKIVKDIFKHYTHRTHTNKFKEKQENIRVFKNLSGGTVKPSRDEIRKNIRSRSAKIRAIYRENHYDKHQVFAPF